MRCRPSSVVLTTLLFAVAAVAPAGEAGQPTLPRNLNATIHASLVCAQPEWVFAQIRQLASAYGAGADAEGIAAELLFFCNSADGVDLLRPAVILWTDAEAPLMAAIPIADRRRFLRGFGSAPRTGRLLLRVDEAADGTIGYTESTIEGIHSYRLLVAEDYAWIAPTAGLAREWSVQGLGDLRRAPPVSYTITAPGLAAMRSGTMPGLMPALGLQALAAGELDHLDRNDLRFLGAAMGMAANSASAVLDQLVHLSLAADNAPGGGVLLSLQARPQSDTALATWASRQTASASRLLPVVSLPTDFFSVHGTLRWQGEMELFGRGMASAYAEAAGDAADPEMVQAIRSLYRLSDRQGPMAMAWGQPKGNTLTQLSGRHVIEQPEPVAYLTHLKAVESLIHGISDAEFGAIDGLVTLRDQIADPDPSAPIMHRLRVATGTHIVEAVDNSVDAANAAVRATLAAMAEPSPLSGATAIVAIRLHLANLASAMAKQFGLQPGPLEDLDLDLALRGGGTRDLSLELVLPITALADLLAETASWRQQR